MVEENRASRPRPSLLRVVFALLFAAHVGLAAAPFADTLVKGAPPDFGDHWIHYTRAQATAAVLENTGSLSGYDPMLVAGYPHGVVDSNSPGSRILVIGLTPLFGLERAYALWVILAFALIPLGVSFSARLLGGGSGCAAMAASATILFLQLDPIARGMGRNGMAAWLLGGSVLLVFASLFFHLLARPSRRRLFATLAVLPLIAAHALLPVLVACAFLIILGAALIKERENRGRVLLSAAAVGAAGLLFNLWWAWPLMRHFGLAGFPAQAFKPKSTQLLWDLASIAWPGVGYFKGSLGMRWALLFLGVYGALRARRERPGVAVLVLSLVPLFLSLAYFGSFSERLVKLECHRLVTTACYLAALGLGPGVAGLRSWAARSRARLAVLGLAAVPVMVSTGAEGLAAVRAPLRPHTLTRVERELLAFFERQPVSGRVLTEQGVNTALTYALASRRRHPLLSFRAAGQPSIHTGWDPLLGYFLGRARGFSVDEVRARFERYAVAWVVPVTIEGRTLMRYLPRDTIVRVAQAGRYEVWRLRKPSSLVASGEGAVEVVPGEIRLTGLRGPIALRLHHHPGLRALEGPEVRIERRPSPEDPVGFIRVDPGGREDVRIVWRP